MPFAIEVKKREAEGAEQIRANGLIPAIVYGPEMKPVSIAIAYHPFELLYRDAGESSLVDVSIESGAPVKALIQDVQYDPVSGRVIHVDFRQINMKKEMQAAIELRFVGEAPAVKELGGTLVKALPMIHIKCLPQDLVGHVDIVLASLINFDTVIRVKDIPLPAGITVLDNLETAVAKVAAPLTEDQIKAMEEQGPKSLEDIEVAEKGKKEEEEPAEGTEAPEAAAAPKEEKK